MFRQFREDFPADTQGPPAPPRPSPEREGEPSRPNLTPRGERIVLLIVCFNLLMLFLTPIAGGTLFDLWSAMAAPDRASTGPIAAPASRSIPPVP